MRKNIKRFILSTAAALLLTACQQSHFNKLPHTGFITHYQQTDHKRMPFDSYWDISDNKDWDERIAGQNNKSQAIYLAPVTLDFFQDMPTDPQKRQQIFALRDYFNKRLLTVMQDLDAKNPNFHLVSAPDSHAYRVEIAILSAKHGSALRNIACDAAGFIVRGSGIIAGEFTDKGYISMGARYYAPSGKLVAEVADFEYGQTSLIGMALVDLKDFIDFAYQRRTIDQWVDEFATLFTTPHEHSVHAPWFTLNPL